jgi:molybdate transport system substrate-binding protein
VVLARLQSEELERQGRIVAGSRVDLAKVAVGIYLAKGALKPDVSSVEALKRSLEAAKSIAYIDPASGAASVIYVAGLIARLGMTEEMAPKVRHFYPAATIFPAVARGEVALAFGQISEILDAAGVDFVGPLPASIQNYTQFTAGVVASTSQADTAKALISCLSSPGATAVLKAKGFETP